MSSHYSFTYGEARMYSDQNESVYSFQKFYSTIKGLIFAHHEGNRWQPSVLELWGPHSLRKASSHQYGNAPLRSSPIKKHVGPHRMFFHKFRQNSSTVIKWIKVTKQT